jgi:hypothetical protein
VTGSKLAHVRRAEDATRSRAFSAWALPALLALLALLPVASPGHAYSVYYANLHSHTALSDGIGTPQEAYAYARDVANIDVLAITDHTHYLTSTEWTTLRNAATAATQSGVFVALASQEFGVLNDFGHINIDDSAFLSPGSTENLLGTYAFIQQVNAFGAFNHPNPSYGTFFNNLTFYPEYENAMRMIEIRNGFYSGDYQAQFHQALANGWKVGPVANQDNHEGHWGDQLNTAGRILLTGILADSLTHDQITDALRARRFFAMEVCPASDRMELDFRIDGQPMGSEITVGICPHFTVEARSVNGTSLFSRVDLYRDGVLRDARSILGTQIFYEYYEALAEGEAHYYYARASQLDGDRAWSSPIWVQAHIDPVGVSSMAIGGPGALRAAPDPFTTTTAVRLVTGDRAVVDGAGGAFRLRVLDPAGRLVRRLDAVMGVDGAAWSWDGRDGSGRTVPPGIYFFRGDGPRGVKAGGRVVRVR